MKLFLDSKAMPLEGKAIKSVYSSILSKNEAFPQRKPLQLLGEMGVSHQEFVRRARNEFGDYFSF